jgi:hypothetical protein
MELGERRLIFRIRPFRTMVFFRLFASVKKT